MLVSDLECAVVGCVRNDALYRVNPKGEGQGFEGMCPEHYEEWVASVFGVERELT